MAYLSRLNRDKCYHDSFLGHDTRLVNFFGVYQTRRYAKKILISLAKHPQTQKPSKQFCFNQIHRPKMATPPPILDAFVTFCTNINQIIKVKDIYFEKGKENKILQIGPRLMDRKGMQQYA